MGRGRGQSVQAGTSGAQGRVYAITSQTEAVDQSTGYVSTLSPMGKGVI